MGFLFEFTDIETIISYMQALQFIDGPFNFPFLNLGVVALSVVSVLEHINC